MEINQGNIKSSKKYFYEISFIRAIACLCVVTVHVTAGFYYENGNSFNWLTQFLNQISRFGTPAFAIISGFLLYNQVIKRGFNFKKFWKSRFTKVITPFFIWSLLYLLIKWKYNLFAIPSLDSSEEIKYFLYYFFTGKSNYHLYFIAIVVQFYLLFPLLQLFKSKKSLMLFTLISFFVNFFFVEYKIEIGNGLFNKFLNERVFFFHWVYYFFMGGLLVYYWDLIIKWIKQNTIFSMLLGLVVVIGGILEYQLAGWIDSNRSLNMINLPLLFVALAGIYSSLSSWNKIKYYFVEIGNLSMGIYLVHPLILFFLRRYEIFNHYFDRTRFLPLVFLFTLFVSIALVKLIVKLPFGNYIVTVVRSNKRSNIRSSEKPTTISA
ncbi:acyltransferase [Virgibacillus dakarensis]|uniref:acyltransferase n=1 Tax=Virgibacillus dakarensis TaxID=1917889 RepID=UPI000B44BBBD|nr:acyltransferase [Virgibacillus dakarensis]